MTKTLRAPSGRSGTPCIVQIDSTRLGISGEVAKKILVTPIEDTPGAKA
jgi:hypothetical protein